MPTGTEIKESPKEMMFAVMVLDVDGTELVLGVLVIEPELSKKIIINNINTN